MKSFCFYQLLREIRDSLIQQRIIWLDIYRVDFMSRVDVSTVALANILNHFIIRGIITAAQYNSL